MGQVRAKADLPQYKSPNKCHEYWRIETVLYCHGLFARSIFLELSGCAAGPAGICKSDSSTQFTSIEPLLHYPSRPFIPPTLAGRKLKSAKFPVSAVAVSLQHRTVFCAHGPDDAGQEKVVCIVVMCLLVAGF